MKNSKDAFKIDGVLYRLPASIKEIKIGRFVKYVKTVLQSCPEELENVLNLEEGETIEQKFEELTALEQKKCFEYFSKVVSFWTGAPEKELKYLELEQLKYYFFYIEFLFGNFEADENFTGFEIKGVEYLPPSKHMRESTLIEFAEAAQFQSNLSELKAGNYAAILDVMAVLCRPKGEEYDEKRNGERKRLFSSLSLDIAVNVGFFLIRLSDILKSNILIYSLEQQKAGQEVEKLGRSMVGIR
jgi:hypothetical protein